MTKNTTPSIEVRKSNNDTVNLLLLQFSWSSFQGLIIESHDCDGIPFTLTFG